MSEALVDGLNPHTRILTPREKVNAFVREHGAQIGISFEDVFRQCRRVDLVVRRQELYLRFFEQFYGRDGWSYLRIARFFQRDHTTILHGVRTARRRREEAAALRG